MWPNRSLGLSNSGRYSFQLAIVDRHARHASPCVANALLLQCLSIREASRRRITLSRRLAWTRWRWPSMLVINERTAMPRSEQRVLEWMRTWTGQYVIVGLAISGCYIPERDHSGRAQEADLLVITPRAVVVLEVKGMAPDASAGTLTVQANGRWRLSGFEGDPIHVREQDTSPFDQVTNNVFNLKALVSKRHPDAFVDGLVVVVPPRESTVTLNVESRRHGCGVVLGSTPGELRAWFHRTAGRRFVWTAEDVHALLEELNFGDKVTVEGLVAEGFPRERKPLLDKVPDRRPREQQPPWIEPDPDVEPIRTPRRSEGGGQAPLIEPEDAERAEVAFPRSTDVPALTPEDGAEAAHAAVALETHRSSNSDEADTLPSPEGLVLVEEDIDPSGSEQAATLPSPEGLVLVEEDIKPSGSEQAATLPSPEGSVLVEEDTKSSGSEQAATSSGHVVLIKDDPRPARAEYPSSALPDSATESQFTDRWSSWILPEAETPRPRATSAEIREPVWLTPEVEPQPLRRLRPAPAPETRPSVAILGRTISLPQTWEGTGVSSMLRDNHRAQQLAACAVVALTLCAIWLMASTCSARPDSSTEPPRPVSQSEVVPPPAPVAEQSGAGPMAVPPVCFPFPPEC
ncbi:nuclease-related domain-containing protein [Nocardia xishanensis]|uniref:nuclease-related domain-containing protein n=1 Tax=Nocardia xishanensis TaxID=238964 RepID=UPI00341A1B92